MKKIVLINLSLALLLIIASFASQKWLANNLQRLINSNPSRSYDITYKSLDFDLFFTGFDLNEATITPLSIDQGPIITGQVLEIKIEGLDWFDLIVDKKIGISELIFRQPVFELIMEPQAADSTKQQPTKNFQQLFGDILSRGHLKKFRLENGSLRMTRKGDEMTEIGHIGDINFEADDIQTDSLQWKFPIPFKVGRFYSSVKDIRFTLNDQSIFSCGSINYDPELSKLSFGEISLKFDKDWLEVSQVLEKQIDLIEFDISSLIINQIAKESELYKDFDLRCESILIDGLVLKNRRDRNFRRPPDVEMPLFRNMVGSIPIGLKVDTILIKNSMISYSELPEGKTTRGEVLFGSLFGSIYNITTLKSFEAEFGQFEADLICKINNVGKTTIRLTIPYDKEGFHLTARMDTLELSELNSTLIPLADINIRSGSISMLELDMLATPTYAQNRMILNYSGLTLDVLKSDNEKIIKQEFVTNVANMMIRSENLPDSKNYIISDYRTERNIYRGPFNFMWLAAKEGFLEILPSKTAKNLSGKGKEKN